MSLVSIRAALETALNGISPSLSTAWENQAFVPVAGTPYQQVTLLPAAPENNVIGNFSRRESGLFHVNLFYPIQVGTSTAMTRAELIRTTFDIGNTFTSGGISVRIMNTPEIGPGGIDRDRYMVPINIRYYADI